MEKDIYIHRKKYQLSSFVGTAVGHQTLSESYTHGNEYRVSTNITTYNDIFLLSDDGKEKHFQLVNWGIPLRTGHTIQILGLYPNNKKEGWYIGAYNVDLDKITWCEYGIKNIVKKKYSIIRTFIIALVALVIIMLPFSKVLIGHADMFVKIELLWFILVFIVRHFLVINFKKTIKSKTMQEFIRK